MRKRWRERWHRNDHLSRKLVVFSRTIMVLMLIMIPVYAFLTVVHFQAGHFLSGAMDMLFMAWFAFLIFVM